MTWVHLGEATLGAVLGVGLMALILFVGLYVYWLCHSSWRGCAKCERRVSLRPVREAVRRLTAWW
jgi:hypothetical protein